MNRVFSGSCEAAREELDAGEEDPGLGGLDGRLEVHGQPPVSIEPGERVLDDPSAGQELEARPPIVGTGVGHISARAVNAVLRPALTGTVRFCPYVVPCPLGLLVAMELSAVPTDGRRWPRADPDTTARLLRY